MTDLEEEDGAERCRPALRRVGANQVPGADGPDDQADDHRDGAGRDLQEDEDRS